MKVWYRKIIFRIDKLQLHFNINTNGHIIELIYEWLPDDKFRKVDTTLCTESTWNKELMDYITMIVDVKRKD